MIRTRNAILQPTGIKRRNIMRKHFIILSVVTVMLVFLSNGIISKASGIVNDENGTIAQKEAICEAIQYVASDTTSYGFSEANFENLQIAAAIPAYEYKNGVFNQIWEYYPIIDGNHIVALAINVFDDKYTIETSLAKNIDQIGFSDIALIYDSQGVYLYNGYDVVLLGYSGIIAPERDTMDLCSDDVAFSRISTADITKTMSLGYIENRDLLGPPNYYSCGVSYVPQAPYSNLCWAATVACIKNCLSGTTLTAGDVSMAYFETSYVVDSTASPSQVASFMQIIYSMSYTFGNYVPSDSVLVTNISNGYPIYGSFAYSGGYHATTIYGVNAITGYISVMDPTYGVATALRNGTTYTYVNSYSGFTLSLSRAICHSW